MENNLPFKWSPKKAGVTILISDILKFIPKTVVRDEEGHYIIRIYPRRGHNNHEYLCPKCGSCQVYQLITKVKTYLDNNTLILGDFNTALSANDRFQKHHISKETRALNDTLEEMDFTDIYRILYPNATEYIFFSSADGIFSRIDHILGHKSGLNR